jgi:hypothetical protein
LNKPPRCNVVVLRVIVMLVIPKTTVGMDICSLQLSVWRLSPGFPRSLSIL